MNQKKAKKLRRLAKKGTVGMPERGYALAGTSEMGGTVRPKDLHLINKLQSTRGTYRWLKSRMTVGSGSSAASRSPSK